MCVILIGKITRDQHQLALSQNPDGFSLFSEELGLVKAPTASQVAMTLGNFAIWHYRIGTSGKMNKSNIHPFEICFGDYYLYHNGVLGAGKGDMSDTRALAETLQNLPVATARTVLTALSAGQRFVLVNAREPRRFELFGQWAAEAGVLMSHKLYTPAARFTLKEHMEE